MNQEKKSRKKQKLGSKRKRIKTRVRKSRQIKNKNNSLDQKKPTNAKEQLH